MHHGLLLPLHLGFPKTTHAVGPVPGRVRPKVHPEGWHRVSSMLCNAQRRGETEVPTRTVYPRGCIVPPGMRCWRDQNQIRSTAVSNCSLDPPYPESEATKASTRAGA